MENQLNDNFTERAIGPQKHFPASQENAGPQKHFPALRSRVFAAVFVLMLVLPLLATNLKKGAVSPTENRFLTEFSWRGPDALSGDVENWLKDRIGFREQILFLYREIADVFFHEYVGQSYGKDDYTFIVTNHEIEDWQRTDPGYDFAQTAGAYLKSVQEYCEDRGIPFFFFLPTSKEEIYGEHFLDTVNVLAENPRRLDVMLQALDQWQIPSVCTRDRYLVMKETKQLYAKKFDPAHWNAHGAFEGAKLLFEELQKRYPELELPGIREDMYEITEEPARTQLNSNWIIRDTLPHYERKEISFRKEMLYPDLEYGTYYTRFVNPSVANGKTLLMFHDSYLMNQEAFYADNFSEIIFLSNVNLWRLPYYINIFDPDLVVYECVQWAFLHRSFSGMMEAFPGKMLAEGGMAACPARICLKGDLLKVPVMAREGLLKIEGNAVFAAGDAGDARTPGTAVCARIYDRVYHADYDRATGNFALTLPAQALRPREIPQPQEPLHTWESYPEDPLYTQNELQPKEAAPAQSSGKGWDTAPSSAALKEPGQGPVLEIFLMNEENKLSEGSIFPIDWLLEP